MEQPVVRDPLEVLREIDTRRLFRAWDFAEPDDPLIILHPRGCGVQWCGFCTCTPILISRPARA